MEKQINPPEFLLFEEIIRQGYVYTIAIHKLRYNPLLKHYDYDKYGIPCYTDNY